MRAAHAATLSHAHTPPRIRIARVAASLLSLRFSVSPGAPPLYQADYISLTGGARGPGAASAGPGSAPLQRLDKMERVADQGGSDSDNVPDDEDSRLCAWRPLCIPQSRWPPSRAACL